MFIYFLDKWVTRIRWEHSLWIY